VPHLDGISTSWHESQYPSQEEGATEEGATVSGALAWCIVRSNFGRACATFFGKGGRVPAAKDTVGSTGGGGSIASSLRNPGARSGAQRTAGGERRGNAGRPRGLGTAYRGGDGGQRPQ